MPIAWMLQPLRFAANGLVAAGVHFLVLVLALDAFQTSSAGLANAIASAFGISASFLGSRYFVFKASRLRAGRQFWRFLLLYMATALLHGCVLLLWTDFAGLDYRVGFLIGTALQAVLTYLGSRVWVFKH